MSGNKRRETVKVDDHEAQLFPQATPPSSPGSGQSRPDMSGIRGGSFSQLSVASGDEFPYDRDGRGKIMGRSFTPGSVKSSASDETTPRLVPANEKDDEELESPWEKLGEAMGIPFSMSLSSRQGANSGMSSVPAAYTDNTHDVDDDDIEKAGSSSVWEEMARILDSLLLKNKADSRETVEDDDDDETVDDDDNDDELEASRTWRGLSQPNFAKIE